MFETTLSLSAEFEQFTRMFSAFYIPFHFVFIMIFKSEKSNATL